MQFGVHLPQIGWEGQESIDLERVIAVASAAERLGFSTVTANDHLVYQRPWLDGPTALAAVLAAAPTVRLMTSVALPVVRGPVALAKIAGRHRPPVGRSARRRPGSGLVRRRLRPRRDPVR